MKEVWRYGDKGKLFNPLRVFLTSLSFHGFHPWLILFNPYRGFETPRLSAPLKRGSADQSL